MKLAPVVLFVYNRPKHTRMVLEALQQCDLSRETELFIYADAPKDASDKELVSKVFAVREIIRERQWTNSVFITEQEKNLGLANSIMQGVSKVLEHHDSVIVLEDDICVTKGFLKYMNDALTTYADDPAVMHVSGYIYPYSRRIKVKEETLFLKINTCWGWATWKRAWKFFNPDTKFHLDLWKTEEERRKFDIEGHACYYLQLEQNNQGIINSWAVKWYSSWLNADGYSLLPKKSLVRNIGNDGTGIHSLRTDKFDMELASSIEVKKLPVQENIAVRKSIDKFYKELYHTIPLPLRIKKAVKSFLTGKEA
ncbi:MAG TPA: glycosyltransferase [Flavipsychrobacter sp.]|nr:glycosyltransferase [Flavipsychrobacter sp.]